MSKTDDKIARVMTEYKNGTLKDPQGNRVTDRAQALAIALSEAGVSAKSLQKTEILNKVRTIKDQLKNQLRKELAKDDSIDRQIYELFGSKDIVTDDDVHGLAEKLNIIPHDLEGKIYAILTGVFHAGKSKGKKIDATPDQIKKGISTEMEHTNNSVIAEKIAMDHFVENQVYYDWLDWMEKLAKKYKTPQEYEDSKNG
jgi:hypothetical protein